MQFLLIVPLWWIFAGIVISFGGAGAGLTSLFQFLLANIVAIDVCIMLLQAIATILLCRAANPQSPKSYLALGLFFAFSMALGVLCVRIFNAIALSFDGPIAGVAVFTQGVNSLTSITMWTLVFCVPVFAVFAGAYGVCLRFVDTVRREPKLWVSLVLLVAGGALLAGFSIYVLDYSLFFELIGGLARIMYS